MEAVVLTRRRILGHLLALPVLGAAGCVSLVEGRSPGRGSGSRIMVDASFAELAFGHLRGPGPATRRRLVEHPALAALLRHRRMTGGGLATLEGLLERVLGRVDVEGGERVLGYWSGRESELAGAGLRALRYLPAGTRLRGRLFLVVGYDIGVVAPPDTAINIAHPHFVGLPREVAHYATHECHHLGFLARRVMPSLERLEDPGRFKEVVRFMTQMEGMAVHAAYLPRKLASELEADQDYAVYLRPRVAGEVVGRFAEIWRSLDDGRTLDRERVGTILQAMSSGERLWYHFGALVCREIERARGRERLLDCIDEPETFWGTACEVMERS